MPYSNAYALHFGAPVVMVAMGGLLAARFIRALRQVEVANVELTRKVDEKEQELRRQFERLREAERREASLTERQRIMQDMHDGLGSQLLTSLAAVERGALDSKGMAQVLRDAMDDMRLAIDTLSPGARGAAGGAGQPALSTRAPLPRRRHRTAFAYRDIPDSLDVAAEDALQILRVLQESLTNVIKHAHAQRVAVEAAFNAKTRPASFSPWRTTAAASILAPPWRVAASRACAVAPRRIGAALEMASGAAAPALPSPTRSVPRPEPHIPHVAGRSGAPFPVSRDSAAAPRSLASIRSARIVRNRRHATKKGSNHGTEIARKRGSARSRALPAWCMAALAALGVALAGKPEAGTGQAAQIAAPVQADSRAASTAPAPTRSRPIRARAMATSSCTTSARRPP